MAGPVLSATLEAQGARGRARRGLLSLARLMRVLFNNYARHKVLSAIDGIPEQTLERGGTSRQALRRDMLAYFREAHMDADSRHEDRLC